MARLHYKRLDRHRLESLERRQLLASAVVGAGTGLIGNYYSDTGLSNLVFTRVDPTINFDWGQGSPAPAVPTDGFSAQWTGKIQAQYSETYTFYTDSDEGVALWVNGQQIIDNFTDHTLAEDSGTISLQAGEMYDIRVAYYDNLFDATMKLSWSSPSTPRQIIPQSQLYGSAGWTSAGWLNTAIGGATGSISSFGSAYNVTGGGNGTTGTSDGVEFLYQTLEGDGTIVAKVARTQGTANGAEAGIMIRDSLDASAPYAAVVVDANGVGHFESRTSAGAVETNAAANQPAGDYWIKLVRDGNLFNGYTSATGADNTWTYFGTQNVVMGQTVFAGLTSTSGTNGGQNAAQFQNVSIISTPPLGAGLDAVRDYSEGNVFVDIAKQARTFQGPNLGPTVATDANGWPMADFMTILLTGYANTAHLYNGTYHGSFTGQATIGTWITPGGQIQNQVYNAATNTTTFNLILNASESADGWYLALQMTNTRRTPDSALGSGITNLKVIRPGYDPNTTQIFQQSYLDQLEQFNTLRFMDWTATNNNPVVDWSQRITLNSATQSSTKGVAWEYVVDLANQLQKNIWINIPANANDDYVTQLAALLKNTLDPNLIVYVEYSNEVWNGIFTQNQDNLNAAIAEVNAGNSPLNADGETNQIYWGWRHVAERLKQISDLFANVWGQSAINARVRCVLASQYSNPLVLQQGLEFIERTYGAPNQFFYAAAEAPYIAMGSVDTTNPNLTPDQIISYLQGSADSNAQKYTTFDTFARRYGLVNMSYEGGPDVGGSNNLAAKKAAMLDPRMEQLVVNYLDGWYNAGGGLFNWFVAGPTVWNANGMWGLTNLPDNTTAPKILGTQDVVNNPRPALTYGVSVPAQFDARTVVGATVPYSTTYLQNPGKGKSFDYYIRVPVAGNYQIVFNGATADTNDQLRIAINDTDVRSLTLTNTGSKTSFIDNIVGTFNLHEGENLIQVTSVNEGAGWNLQTVRVSAASTSNVKPTVAIAANASPLSVNGKTTTLSVLGADDGGESNLAYSWQAVDESPTSVTFSANGSNAAKNTTATFTRAGIYKLLCTISDGVSSTTSSVVVTVNQVITSVTVAPSGSPIANGETVQLVATAKDQFGIQLYSQPAFAWRVTNGFGAISAAGLYQAPASGLGTANISATVGAMTGTATVVIQSPAPADSVANPLDGLLYNYYTGSFSSVPTFSTLTPAKTGVTDSVSLSPATQTSNFALQFTGYVYVPSAATYSFYISSDDGSKLWVGGQLVVNNDGSHTAQEKSGSIILESGWHQFQVGYYQGSGNETLGVSYSSPSIAKQAIPASSFERADIAPVVATPPAFSPNPVTAKSASLSVVGSDESGESALTYTWSATSIPSGASAPTFTVNSSNAAKNSTATFSRAGTYQLQVAISDGTVTTTAPLTITVNATLTSIQISPSTPTLQQNHALQFSATGFDQFTNALASQPTFNWSTTANGGTINSAGLYTAPDATGTFAITASSSGVSATKNVSVTADNPPTVASPASATQLADNQFQLNVLGADDDGEANLTYTWSVTSLPPGAAQPTFSNNASNSAKNTIVTLSQPGDYELLVTISDGYKTITSGVTASVITSSTPTVVIPASASPSPVTGTSTQLSVLGDDDTGESNLTYTWSTIGTPPAAVSFNTNSSNAAKNTAVSFARAGTYNFLVTISDGSLSTTSSVSVTVNQTLSSIAVAPSSALVVQGANKLFTATAYDQFAQPMTSQPMFAWSVSGSGTTGSITQSGVYTAPAGATPTDTVTASAGGMAASAQVTVVAAAQGDPFTSDADVGSPSIPGSASFDGDTYSVQASGADIFGSSDQFHYVYRQLTGDGTIITRVASVQNTNTAAKAGVMFRESLDANARFVDLVLRPDKSTSLQWRAQTGSGTSLDTSTGANIPYWLKLTRSGNTFSAYRSSDGINWTLVGNTTTALSSTLYVGLVVTSHDNTKLNTSTFDHVQVQQGTQLSGKIITGPSHSVRTSGGIITQPAWIGLDLGSPETITEVRYTAPLGSEVGAVGGIFEASNAANFSTFTDLYTISTKPAGGVVTTKSIETAAAFRYVRYIAPNGSSNGLSYIGYIGF